MGSPTDSELTVLISLAKNCNYVLETGSGYSTRCFARSLVRVMSIDLIKPKLDHKPVMGLETYITGWSIAPGDVIGPEHKYFEESRYKNTPDEDVALGKCKMEGRTDLIRETIKTYGLPQFFFCDTGEYCGYSEWLIMKDMLPVGGFIALHDIHFPKSIKNHRAYEEILDSRHEWELIYKSATRAGLCVARKIK